MKIKIQKGLISGINSCRADQGEYCQVSLNPVTGDVFGDFLVDFTRTKRSKSAENAVTLGLYPKIRVSAQASGYGYIWQPVSFGDLLEAAFLAKTSA